MRYTCNSSLLSLIISDKKMLNNDELLLLMAAGAVVHQFIAATYVLSVREVVLLAASENGV
jgi:hypothetical protein